MMRNYVGLACTCMLAIGCGKGGDGGSAGSATGGTSGAASATTADDDCKHILICASLPAAHVDSLCGTTTAKTTPVDTEKPVAVNTCQYVNAKNDTDFMISRTCHPAAAGGVDRAKQFYKLIHDDTSPQQTKADMAGVGDEALYRGATTHTRSALMVRKGNVVTMIEHANITAATEETIKTKCLIALYNELAAK